MVAKVASQQHTSITNPSKKQRTELNIMAGS
jgi:hypothetical protein